MTDDTTPPVDDEAEQDVRNDEVPLHPDDPEPGEDDPDAQHEPAEGEG